MFLDGIFGEETLKTSTTKLLSMNKRKTPYVDSNDSTSFDAWMQQLMKSGEKLGD